MENETDLGMYNIYMGRTLPEAVYVVFIPQVAYNGGAKHNPFYFSTIELLEASLLVNSYNEPTTPLTNTNESKKKLDLYYDFLRNTGGSHLESQAVNVDYDSYYGGSFMLAFDRTKSKDNRYRRTEPDSGTISLNLKAKTGLSENTVVLVYATYSSRIDFSGEEVTTLTF